MALITVSNNALSAITALPASIPTGALTLIKSITASASASISFVDGTDSVVLDDTYSSYVFKFINCHPSTDSVGFGFNGSIDNGSNYNVTKTTTSFDSAHKEDDTDTGFGYGASRDLAQSTADQMFMGGGSNLGADNDQSISGTLTLFNPSSSTFVKHFVGTSNGTEYRDWSWSHHVAGYFNTTSAVNAVIFRMSSGNIDDGIIKLYGVS